MTSLHTKLKELRELARTSPIKINAKVPALISALERAVDKLDRLTKCGPPSRSCDGHEASQIMLSDNCKTANEALAEIAEMLEKD